LANSADPLFTKSLVDQPPLYSSPRGNLANFIGEDPLPIPSVSDKPSHVPPHLHASPSDTASLAGPPPGPSAWSNEQRQEFLQALLGSTPNEPRPVGINVASGIPGAEPEDPLLTLMSSLGVGEHVFQGAGGASQSKMEEKPKTSVQKLLPLLHLIAVWALVGFFIFWKEPESFRARHSTIPSSGGVWNRWARLASGPADRSSWGIETQVSLSLAAAAQ
jgi:GET complex subunit GET2